MNKDNGVPTLFNMTEEQTENEPPRAKFKMARTDSFVSLMIVGRAMGDHSDHSDDQRSGIHRHRYP
eukprot:scaffold121352_cov53-Attheya_sp.AAC.6